MKKTSLRVYALEFNQVPGTIHLWVYFLTALPYASPTKQHRFELAGKKATNHITPKDCRVSFSKDFFLKKQPHSQRLRNTMYSQLSYEQKSCLEEESNSKAIFSRYFPAFQVSTMQTLELHWTLKVALGSLIKGLTFFKIKSS